jgi:hypothetical protein
VFAPRRIAQIAHIIVPEASLVVTPEAAATCGLGARHDHRILPSQATPNGDRVLLGGVSEWLLRGQGRERS